MRYMVFGSTLSVTFAGRPLIRNRKAGWLLQWLLLLLAMILGASWQWHARAHQHIDVGAALDDGYTINFHAPEQSTTNDRLDFRWSRLNSEIQLWPTPTDVPLQLDLHMLAPPQPDGPQQTTLSLNQQQVTEIALANELRTYTFVVEPTNNSALRLGLDSPRLTLDGDPRELGVAVDQIELRALTGPTFLGLVRELGTLPFLPLGLLLLAISTWLSGIASRWIGLLPLLALLLTIIAGWAIPDAQLVIASFVVIGGVVVAGALGLMALLCRLPKLWPSTDQQAFRWIAIIFVGVFLLTFAPVIKSDGVGYYVYLRSLTIDGDLKFDNEYVEAPFRHLPHPEDILMTETGHFINPFAVGPAILWSPLYSIAHVIVQVGQAFGLPWQADGYADPYVVLSVFTSALAALIIMFTGYRICRRWVAPPIALLAVVTALLGSNLLYYTMREGGFAHALSAAMTSLFVLAWLRLEEQPTVRRWAVMGLASGGIVLLYWMSAILWILPGLTFLRLLIGAIGSAQPQRLSQLRQLFTGGVIAALLALLVFSPQMVAWQIIFGSFLTAPQGSNYISPQSFKGVQLLFSHLHGLLPWTPAFFAGLVGLAFLWPHSRWQTLCFGVACALYLGYNASIWQWHGGGAFGGRRLIVLTPCFIIGLALLLNILRRWGAALPIALAALMSAWTTLLLVRYDWYLIPHDPGRIEDMPISAFYLSRNVLPIWGLPDWLQNTYFMHELRVILATGFNPEFVAIATVMIITTTLTVVLHSRIPTSTSAPTSPTQTQRVYPMKQQDPV